MLYPNVITLNTGDMGKYCFKPHPCFCEATSSRPCILYSFIYNTFNFQNIRHQPLPLPEVSVVKMLRPSPSTLILAVVLAVVMSLQCFFPVCFCILPGLILAIMVWCVMMEYMLERGKMYPIASYVVPQSKYEFGI